MKFCKRCLTPNTHPLTALDGEGTCTGCRQFERRQTVDWSRRRELFDGVVESARERSTGYDCVIPVSGGKDSHWQVIKCLERGMNPLGVTWKTPDRTEIGRRNLENLIDLGIDHIEYSIKPRVERIFTRKSFKKHGAVGIPKHMAVLNIPLTVALEFDIPLIVWGENSAAEYGDATEEQKGFLLDDRWIRDFGSTHGTQAEDWVDDELTRSDLHPYFGPSSDDLEDAGIRAVFLGYYFPWDPKRSYEIARDHGFEARDGDAQTGYYDFGDLEDHYISVHHYLKWFKFGYTRLFDDLSIEIRQDRLTRQEAVQELNERGIPPPREDIEQFCEFVGITREEFFRTAHQFRNEDLWRREAGSWVIPDFILRDDDFWERSTLPEPDDLPGE